MYLYGDSVEYLLESLGYSTDISKVMFDVKQKTAFVEWDNYLDKSGLILEVSAIRIPINNNYSIGMINILKAICENEGEDYDCKDDILRLIELYPKKKSLVELLGVSESYEMVDEDYYLPPKTLYSHKFNFPNLPNFSEFSKDLME